MGYLLYSGLQFKAMKGVLQNCCNRIQLLTGQVARQLMAGQLSMQRATEVMSLYSDH